MTAAKSSETSLMAAISAPFCSAVFSDCFCFGCLFFVVVVVVFSYFFLEIVKESNSPKDFKDTSNNFGRSHADF